MSLYQHVHTNTRSDNFTYAKQIKQISRVLRCGNDNISQVRANSPPQSDISFRALSLPYCWRVVWIFARPDIGMSVQSCSEELPKL